MGIYTDVIETCGIVEFLHSFEMLTAIGGDPIWDDRCESLAFNSLQERTSSGKSLCLNLVSGSQ
jgi:hypothetical protein